MIVVLVVVGKSSSSALSLFCCPPTDDDDDDDDSSSTHPRLPQQSKSFLRLAILRLSFFRVCRKRILNSGGEGSKEYSYGPKEKTQKRRERAREGLFLVRVFKIFKKKKISLSFSPLLSREKRKFFLKNEKKKHFSKNTFVGRERKTARRFLNHLSNHRIKSSSLSAVCKEERDKRR